MCAELCVVTRRHARAPTVRRRVVVVVVDDGADDDDAFACLPARLPPQLSCRRRVKRIDSERFAILISLTPSD